MAGKPTSINDLPDKILLKILSYVGPEDVYFNIAKVCKKWNILAKNVILWKTLSYNCDGSSDISRIAEVLTVAPALHSLTIRDRIDAAHILELLLYIRGLRKLRIHQGFRLYEDITGLFANIVAFYPDLEVLSLAGYHQLKSAGYNLIPRLKKLSELKLTLCQGLSGETVHLIVDSCQHLKKLGLDGVRLTDDDVIHVIEKIGKQLTTLVLDGEDLTDVAYLYLNNCARLQELEISFCRNMTDRGLLEGIGSLQELASLGLIDNDNLTAQALSKFLHRPSMNSIVLLNLSYCTNLDDEGLKGIAKRCIRLKELAVSECINVSDAGISIVISHCNQLCLLNLMGLEYITGEEWLALVPSHLPHLRRLCLAGCNDVCDKYVEELMAAVPELKVTR